jgi:hypothetical protein
MKFRSAFKLFNFATPRRRGLSVFGILILPVLIAIWFVPWLVTQDGPLHLLNAHIMGELLKSHSPFGELYSVRWDPLPYWGAHMCLTGLMSLLSDRTADRILLTITSVGLASAIVWLRWRVAGWEGMAIIAPLAVILSLNMLWLLGLYSFLMGACLMLVTLGAWWGWRERMGPAQASVIAALLVLGYLSHLVSMGLTAFGLVVLALTTPGSNWLRRCGWTAASFVPMIPLAVMYHRVMQTVEAVSPSWYGLKDSWSLTEWFNYARGIDFVVLRSIKNTPPFADNEADWFAFFTPTLWVTIAVVVLLVVTLLARGDSFVRERRGWIVLSLLLFAGAWVGPDNFGGAHGGILRERLLLLAMATSVPAFKLDSGRWVVRACAAGLMIAAIMQLAYLWDYALFSNRVVGDFMQAKPYVGKGQRVETIQIDTGGPYRVNPVHNLSSVLGIGTDNIVWNNYGPCLYYFPVKFTDDAVSRRALDLSDVSVFRFKNSLYDETKHLQWWSQLLSETHGEIDTLVIMGSNPLIDEINAQWYEREPVFQTGDVRVFRSNAHNVKESHAAKAPE